jgi:acetylornithine aminotransferase
VQEVRGSGLLVGVQLAKPAGSIVGAARARGLIVITAGAGDVVRLVPPLTCTVEEIDECVRVLAECISEL